jgi:hypothetical protein
LVRSRWRRASVSIVGEKCSRHRTLNTREEAFSDERRDPRYFLNPKADRKFTKSDRLTGILAGSQGLTDIETLFEIWL